MALLCFITFESFFHVAECNLLFFRLPNATVVDLAGRRITLGEVKVNWLLINKKWHQVITIISGTESSVLMLILILLSSKLVHILILFSPKLVQQRC